MSKIDRPIIPVTQMGDTITDKKTVYSAWTRQVVFQGTDKECWDWIIGQAYTFKDGRKLYRTWEYEGDTYYDVGPVYIFNK